MGLQYVPFGPAERPVSPCQTACLGFGCGRHGVLEPPPQLFRKVRKKAFYRKYHYNFAAFSMQPFAPVRVRSCIIQSMISPVKAVWPSIFLRQAVTFSIFFPIFALGKLHSGNRSSRYDARIVSTIPSRLHCLCIKPTATHALPLCPTSGSRARAAAANATINKQLVR